MDWEKRLDIDNIILAYRFKIMTFSDAVKRIKRIYQLHNLQTKKINYHLN